MQVKEKSWKKKYGRFVITTEHDICRTHGLRCDETCKFIRKRHRWDTLHRGKKLDRMLQKPVVGWKVWNDSDWNMKKKAR